MLNNYPRVIISFATKEGQRASASRLVVGNSMTRRRPRSSDRTARSQPGAGGLRDPGRPGRLTSHRATGRGSDRSLRFRGGGGFARPTTGVPPISDADLKPTRTCGNDMPAHRDRENAAYDGIVRLAGDRRRPRAESMSARMNSVDLGENLLRTVRTRHRKARQCVVLPLSLSTHLPLRWCWACGWQMLR